MTVTQRGAVQVYRLTGRLSVLGADEFEQSLLQAIDAGARRLVFVMDGLNYVSSAGLRVFFVAIKRLGGDATRLSFAGLTPAVQTIFDVVGLSQMARVYATEAEALADLPADGSA